MRVILDTYNLGICHCDTESSDGEAIRAINMKQPAVYIMANKRNGTLYTGVTSDLVKRIYQHRNHLTPGFTSKYDCVLLVYYELIDFMETAIMREKQIKGGSRNKKMILIESQNPEWLDLYENIRV